MSRQPNRNKNASFATIVLFLFHKLSYIYSINQAVITMCRTMTYSVKLNISS